MRVIGLTKKICGNCFARSSGKVCHSCGSALSRSTAEYDVLPIGTVLNGKYTVGRVLGRGGFGIIYLVYDEETDRTAAVKEYYPERTAIRAHNNIDVEPMTSLNAEEFSSGMIKFTQEAEFISRFSESSEILGIHDVFRQNGTAYYTMDYIKGVSLKDYVTQCGAITESQAVYIAERILTALRIIHGGGVLHRDISPDNIMLCANGAVRLVDFGAARAIPENSESMSVILKAGFAPLEQYRRKGNQGGWTDIYSLSMSLFFGLTLKEPEDPLSRLDNDDIVPETLNNVSPALAQIILKGGAVRSDERFQSAEDMLSAMESCGTAPEPVNISECTVSEPFAPAPAKTYRKSKRKPLLACGIFLGAAAAIAAAVFAFKETPDEAHRVKIGGEFFPTDSTRLDLSNRELTNQQIFNLSHLKNLEYLNLSGNYITDLSCLDGLSEMDSLFFSNNNVSDISFAASMPKLRQFVAENCGISDISALADKTQLEYVFIGDNYVTDISPLENCNKLKQIGFNEAQIGNIEALRDKTDLEKVCLTGCNLTSIEPLTNCKKLRYVYLGRNRLTDISPLEGCEIAEFYLDNNLLSGNTDSFRGITVNGFVCAEGNGFTEGEIYRIVNIMLSGDFELYY